MLKATDKIITAIAIGIELLWCSDSVASLSY